jgi:hypothetical protein
MTTKKGIFISHIHEEASLGAVVKDWATDAFLGSAVAAFLSSDDQDLPAGRKWLDVIEKQVAEAGVMISLLSPASLARPWVNIELGAAWINHVPVIPLCHSGLAIANLPRPFGHFNAVALDQDNAAKRLIGGIADALGLAHPKKLHFEQCLQQMRAAAARSEFVQVALAAEVSAASLPQQQVEILRLLAKWENGGNDELPGDGAAMLCGVNETEFKYHTKQLADAGLIHISHYGNGSRTYKNTPDGAGWLVERGLIPD